MKTIARIACLVAVASSSLAVSACASDAQQHAMHGKDALDRCDMRAADTEFKAAYEGDPTNRDFALAYALSDLAVLAEDPALTSLAPRFGFDQPIDSSILWGHDGILDRLSTHATCNAVNDVITTRFPHPSLRGPDPRPDFVSTIDPTLTLGDARTALVALSPRFHEIAEALIVAADGMSSDGVLLPNGGCGVGTTPTRVQAPELYALASGLEAIRAATQASLAYDGAVPFKLLFSQSSDYGGWASTMNGHLLRITDASQLPPAKPMLAHAVDLAAKAVAAAGAAHDTSDAVFDWTSLPPTVLSDVDAFVTGSQTALATDGPVAIPRMTPALSMDASSFLSSSTPFDLAAAPHPLWTVMTDPMFGSTWVDFDSATLDTMLASRFDQDPWATGAPSRSFSVDWSTVTSTQWSATFDPGSRWTGGYMCASTP